MSLTRREIWQETSTAECGKASVQHKCVTLFCWFASMFCLALAQTVISKALIGVFFDLVAALLFIFTVTSFFKLSVIIKSFTYFSISVLQSPWFYSFSELDANLSGFTAENIALLSATVFPRALKEMWMNTLGGFQQCDMLLLCGANGPWHAPQFQTRAIVCARKGI